MDKANNTPSIISLREALTGVSFEELKSLLHRGCLLARHRALYTSPGGAVRSGPGNLPPALWATADYKNRAEQVIFYLDPVVAEGCVVDEVVFAYASDITFDRRAYETLAPIATGSAESDGMRAAQERIPAQNAETAFSTLVASPPKKVSKANLTNWYVKTYIPGHATGPRPSREQDEVAADDHFKGIRASGLAAGSETGPRTRLLAKSRSKS